MRTPLAAFVFVLPLLTQAAIADEPPLDEIVRRAQKVADQKPSHVTCKMNADTQLFDKSGKLEHHDVREGEAILDGDDTDLHTARAWKDGRELSAEELAKERAKADKARAERKKDKGGDDGFELSPLAGKNAAGEKFELVRKETLWGHEAYLLRVTATGTQPSLANGMVWIDAATFVELKGELTPARLPEHTDWLKVQEQFTLARGVAVPAYLHIQGAGHLLMFKKSFESTIRWSACR
jgi:hypothetical protein